MTTITIEVADELARQLAEEAERLHLNFQDFAVQKLSQPADVSAEFVELTRQLIEEDRELLERLA